MASRLVRIAPALAVAFLAVVVALAVLAGHLYRFATSPIQSEGESHLVVPEGASFQAVIGQLIERGLATPVEAPKLKLLARYRGVASRVHAGEYRIGAETTPLSLLKALEEGDVVSHSVTLPEGWRVARVLKRLRGIEALDSSDLPEGPEDRDLLRLLGLLGKERAHAEGWLFPDTYSFQRGTRAQRILERSHQRMEAILEEEWAQCEAGDTLSSPYEVLILASIVEKETAVPEERPMIAGVFLNRLRTGMRLQADPTVIYGLGEAFDGNLQRSDLEDPTPYNTYQKPGLPPTPIANPGRAAIHAACHPADTEARYFVSTGDGSHVFSETLEGHNRAVREHQLGGR